MIVTNPESIDDPESEVSKPIKKATSSKSSKSRSQSNFKKKNYHINQTDIPFQKRRRLLRNERKSLRMEPRLLMTPSLIHPLRKPAREQLMRQKKDLSKFRRKKSFRMLKMTSHWSNLRQRAKQSIRRKQKVSSLPAFLPPQCRRYTRI